MSATRRKVLLGTAATAAAVLSGCQTSPFSEPPNLDLHLYNYTSTAQGVQVRILRADANEHGDATVFSRDFDVPAPPAGESAGTLREADVVERRPYVVRVRPKQGNGQWHHRHYYPDGTATDDGGGILDVRLYRETATGHVYPRFFG